MTKKLIFFNPDEAGKLHCDSCGHDLPETQPFVETLVGTPCPKCSANMLTEADYLATAKIIKFITFINRWFGWLGHEEPRDDYEHMRLKYHDGQVEVKKD